MGLVIFRLVCQNVEKKTTKEEEEEKEKEKEKKKKRLMINSGRGPCDNT